MPTIDIRLSDLESLLGAELPKEVDKLNEVLSFIKAGATPAGTGAGSIEDLRIELRDGNRPDLWSVEGMAVSLRGFLGIRRASRCRIAGSSGTTVSVDPRLKDIRPFICCSVVKGVKLTDNVIRGLMQLQEKLDETYGRRRRRTSIGLYDFDLVRPPLTYGVSRPDEFSFVPLGFSEKMTLGEILERHPKGVEYGHLIKHHPVWPILHDSRRNVLSLPPIINSNDLGRITEDTKNVLVEVTGTSGETVSNTLNIVTLSLAERRGSVYSVRVKYPYGGRRNVVTPILKPGRIKVSLSETSSLLGLPLSRRKVAELLERAGFRVLGAGRGSITVEVPFYRIDVMHPVDVMEDVAIAYGVNSMAPRWPSLVTIGALDPREKSKDLVRELMVGFGFQEVLTYVLTNKEDLFSKMNLGAQDVVEIANPRIATYNCLRSWLLPSLMAFLGQNTHVSYPQKIFEVGYCVVPDGREENGSRDVLKLACASIGPNAGFTEMKSVLHSLLLNLSRPYGLEETGHPSFIDGRCGRVIVGGEDVGVLGEINPTVLEAFGLSEPAAAFELELCEKLIGLG
ncbi:MAG: phenylalanine--tRNA ligase subunit beta [Candidatus Brockarchaeota archaeon]|nr:phenylalanine--tRNA ligase subunit beta [Candidatus Brockarchaeota archaeon]